METNEVAKLNYVTSAPTSKDKTPKEANAVKTWKAELKTYPAEVVKGSNSPT